MEENAEGAVTKKIGRLTCANRPFVKEKKLFIAGLAVPVSGDTALVGAILGFGFGFFAAGLLGFFFTFRNG